MSLYILTILNPIFHRPFTYYNKCIDNLLSFFKVAQYSCMIVKYDKDTRYDESGITTHDKNTLGAVPVSFLAQLTDKVADYDVIGNSTYNFKKRYFLLIDYNENFYTASFY